KRLALRFLRDPPPIACERPTLNPAELDRVATRITKEPASPADIRLHVDGTDALSALDCVIDSACCRLDVLMYLWGNDEIGWHAARRLAARAEAGVAVRVLVDGGGNLAQGEPKDATTAEVNAAVCWLARQPNVALVRTRSS